MKRNVVVTALAAVISVLLPVLIVSGFAGLGERVCRRDAGPVSVVTVHPHEEILEAAEKQGRLTVFLAGTIDMGAGEDWQSRADSLFRALPYGKFMLFNPRQKEWDPSRQGEMEYQVNWELGHMEEADCIIMNFLPGSSSPVTLLELGLHARGGKLLVVCPEEFYRYDNVRITCGRYGVEMFASLEDAVRHVSHRIRGKED